MSIEKLRLIFKVRVAQACFCWVNSFGGIEQQIDLFMVKEFATYSIINRTLTDRV
jgi:hypothetical protein